MHHCLTVIEVQHVIFREVLKGYWQGSRTLARLARTCRTFHNAALDILWETLPSIRHLVRCLPGNLWNFIDHRKQVTFGKYAHIKEIKFQRSMSPDEWNTFFKYSSRIRSLSTRGQSSQGALPLGISVITALSQPPTGLLVPGLKTLHWTENDEKYAPLLQSLLTRSLVSLELPSHTLESPGMPMNLITRCPSLKNLGIQGDKISPETVVHLYALKLLELECCALDGSVIVALAQFPSLVKLSAQLPFGFPLQELMRYPDQPVFVSLESLSLQVDKLSTLTVLLEGVRFRPRMVSFEAASAKLTTLDVLHQFFVVLANACDSEQLSSLRLITSDHGTNLVPVDRPQVSLSTFEPLLVLPNTEDFTFDALYDISLDDAALDTLTHHWPKLTTFSLNALSGWARWANSKVTHVGLITLLSRCTSLTEFALDVDLTGIDISPGLIRTLRTDKITSRCRRANFVTSKIRYPFSLAFFLSGICPTLEKVSSFWISNEFEMDTGGDSYDIRESESEFDDYRIAWSDVDKMVKGFLELRTHGFE